MELRLSYCKAKGIVIKEVNTGEADKILTIFALGKGKITGFAKGARRPKSKIIAGSQFLCYSDFVLFKGRDMYTVNSSDIIEPFYELRNDIIKLTYSAYLVDLVYDAVQENQPSTRVLQLFLNTLYALAKSNKSPELLARIFEIRLLTILGYAPYAGGCLECGKESVDRVYFSFKKCGFLCEKCNLSHDEYAVPIFSGTAKAINHIVYSPIKNLYNFELSPEVLVELGTVSRRYLRDRFEKEYNRLDFLKSFKTGVL